MTTLKTLLALAMTSAATTCYAAQPVSAPAPEYRLNVKTPAAYRLITNAIEATPVEARKESATALQLANKPFAKLIDDAARNAALDPALVHAVIAVESGYNPAARSPKGAIGLMQLMPETASRYGVHNAAHSPEANLRAGTLYLSDLMQMFDQRIDLALAAYNAGENAVLRHGQRIPPYRETQLYVPAVLARYLEWREPVPVLPAPPPVPQRIQYMQGTTLNVEALRAAGDRQVIP